MSIEHDYGGGLKLRDRTLFGGTRKFYQNVSGDVDAATAMAFERLRQPQQPHEPVASRSCSDDGLAGIDQTLLFGFEVGRERSSNERLTAILSQTTTPIGGWTVESDAIFAPSPPTWPAAWR